MFARLAPLEAKLAELEGRDPQAALDRFADAARGVQGRLAAIEDAENPFAEISEQLTRLYAQKDATVETVFARLAPLEARLAELEAATRRRRSTASPRGSRRCRAGWRRSRRENPFAEISEQLTRLYAQKDATVETVFARLAPLEARLAELEGRDPQAALDRFAARLEAVQGRLAAIEAREPVRGDLRAADPALRPEGRDRRDGVRPARAAGGEARRARGPRPAGGARPLRRAARGGAGPAGGDRGARTRSPRSPSS